MFIDISTYVGHWPFRNLEYNTLAGLDKLACENGITHMVVSNLNGFFYKDANTANLELLKELKEYSGKTVFLPLAIINPTYVEWEKDARAMIDAGFAGFEIAPIYHGYTLMPQQLYDHNLLTDYATPVFDLAAELDVPVRICASFENFRCRGLFDPFENVSGNDLYFPLSRNTDVHVFITSFSPAASGEKLAALLKTRKNTYFDFTTTESFNSAAAKAACSVASPEQICYGSLSPFNYMETTLVRLAYGEEYKGNDGIKAENARRAFKSLR